MTIVLIAIIVLVFYIGLRRQRLRHRQDFILSYVFDPSIDRQLQHTYPHLSPQQRQQVLATLKDYFLFCVMAEYKGLGMLSMPSQAVDEAWHAFILSTKAYDRFCRRAFGYFLHHHPAETMLSPTQATKGIKRTWNLACQHEVINPDTPNRLPRIFALDAQLAIANGFIYHLDCMKANHQESYCGSHIGSGCGGGSCSGDSSADSGCSGGCGGGD
ncbi:glycine-rich domain-containing protein [Agitococcus lubricus]|uniref:Uncharacterized protein n=1 Tax=Agitococcus lubricus TaxID=1077255 RepID=A0A2T5IUZ2_9GAMM|nr:hypothetical protein [Agitococcus lubricus]PTQ87705.1 hypothetical protein C8N29_11729 [Agitococcus lubricus]